MQALVPNDKLDALLTAADTYSDPIEAGAQALTAEAITRRALEGGAAAALMAVGRIQGLDLVRRVTDVAAAQAFETLAASKAYRGIPYTDEQGQPAVCETLDQFCAHFLGRGYRRMAELRGNLHTLGAELYEAAERVGFKARDYAALRALPADDQEAVRLALADGDSDPRRALDVLTDLLTRAGARALEAEAAREAAEGERDEARANYQAASKIAGERSAELARLKQDRLAKPATLDESMEAWAAFVAQQVAEIRHRLAQIDQVRASCMDLDPPADLAGPAGAAYRRGLRLVADAIGQPLGELASDVDGVLSVFDATLAAVAYVDQQEAC